MKLVLIICALVLASHVAQAQEPEKDEKPDTVKKEKSKKGKDLPLKIGRRVPIKTTEGSWMSLDVSPDGKTIAFDFLGDIFTMPFSGGKPTQFTKGMAFDSQPKFSPDGTKLLFISDRSGGENIWWFSLDKNDSLQVTKAAIDHYQSAEWTPDGNYIIGSRGTRNLKLWMFHKDGGAGIQLISKPDNLKTVEAAFGPDNRYIWFAQRTGAWNYNAQLPQYQLARPSHLIFWVTSSPCLSRVASPRNSPREWRLTHNRNLAPTEQNFYSFLTGAVEKTSGGFRLIKMIPCKLPKLPSTTTNLPNGHPMEITSLAHEARAI